jgi:hypothetical protein
VIGKERRLFEHRLPDAAQALYVCIRPKQSPGHYVAAADNYLGRERGRLLLEVGKASRMCSFMIVLAQRPAFQQVRDVDTFTTDPAFGQRRLQRLPGSADEGGALLVLAGAWVIQNNQERRVDVPFTPDHAGALPA